MLQTQSLAIGCESNRKSHMHFRLVPKSLTLDDLERPIRTLLQKRFVFGSPVQKFQWRMKIDLYYQRHECRPLSLVSRNIMVGYMRIMDIRGGSSGRGLKRYWGWRRHQFSAITVATSSSSSASSSSSFIGSQTNSATQTNFRKMTVWAGQLG